MYSVIDIEGKEKIYAFVILHKGVYHIFNRYGISEFDITEFLNLQGIEIDYEIVNEDYLLERLNDILIGWNLYFDLRMIEKEFPYLLTDMQFRIIDMYREIMRLTGEAYSLGNYVYEHYGFRIKRYSARFKPEKMYRYLKCITDVYFTNIIYQHYKDKVKIIDVNYSDLEYL